MRPSLSMDLVSKRVLNISDSNGLSFMAAPVPTGESTRQSDGTDKLENSPLKSEEVFTPDSSLKFPCFSQTLQVQAG